MYLKYGSMQVDTRRAQDRLRASGKKQAASLTAVPFWGGEEGARTAQKEGSFSMGQRRRYAGPAHATWTMGTGCT